MASFISAAEAVELIQNGQTIASSGFGFAAAPEEILAEMGRAFRQKGRPRDLTLVFSSAQGNSKDLGLDHLAQPGLLKRVVGGFYGVTHQLLDLVSSNHTEGYNLPQGQITRLYHAIASRQPGHLTKVGMGTFIDPRLEGGKMSASAREDLVELVELSGEQWLLYRSFPIHVALVRATTADERGNLTMEREAVRLEGLPMAAAAKAHGGVVIAQVERLASAGSLHPAEVVLPGYMVDAVVLAQEPTGGHMQTVNRYFDPTLTGEVNSPMSRVPPLDPGPRRIIARRASRELAPGSVVNLGTGIPEGVGADLGERGATNEVFLTVESGVSGGIAARQPEFGVATNPEAIIRHDDQFLFYNAGGIDVTCLGFAQIDGQGNVNVSRFGDKIVGCGGFIDIAQNAKKVVFCGTFNSGGLEVAMKPDGIAIKREGRHQKFVEQVEQITFSGEYARQTGQTVLVVTERCVLKLTGGGFELIEIAQGVDLQQNILDLIPFTVRLSPGLRQMDRACFA
ncbi:MAG: acyl CoA:acetate/3-ketoacid CoA transferase [Proteobacteria bacterium]|nr:acyl CoA:acetate/3-ketoacid CoA transferase [Pseudomonadota bacterium]MBU1451736.1 acyl CoA:acetate/3-ketoacid CoA transferase [Pseudomonadota bacterium]MBU2469272.1 acyl CoA:acetate/3-ketoacid CoA transferase [Pseudomonadota bacterium]MBU2517556.1 acyl CoA:acetate/3-ketoacid CoA transferase [Pseudomonadota bacterium]